MAAAVAGGRRQIAYKKEMALKQLETNIDLASGYIQTGDIANPRVYSTTCMKIGRSAIVKCSSIDSAIAMNAFPSTFHLHKLFTIVKEVYRRSTELLRPSLMLLLLPIKAACKIGWFPDGDKDGLLMLAKEVSYGFSNADKMNIEPSNAHSSVSNIVSRFYPTMKVEHILTSFGVKAGYGTFLADFHLSVGTTPRNCRNLWLLVAQLDNMDTSACITGPLNVELNCNVIEMSSRISLYCPISKHRIKTPVKGHLCKHPQILNVVAKDVDDVIISEDGSWMAAETNRDTMNPATTPAVNVCTITQAQSTTAFTLPAGSPGQAQVNVCTTNQAQSTTLLTPPATVTIPAVSPGQNQVNVCTTNQAQCTTVLTPPAGSTGQTEVKICTSTQAKGKTMCPPPAGSPCQIRVNDCTINQGQSTTMFATETKPAVSPGQTHVNVYTTKQAQSTTLFTPPAGPPGQSQVNICSRNQTQTTPMFQPPTTKTEPAVSPSQSQVNICTRNQTQTTPMFTPPTTKIEPAVSPSQSQVNVCTTTQAKSTTMFTIAGESQPAPNIRRVPPEASVDAKPSGRMRGSLKGDQLEAARLQYLAPPQQPALANAPWSRPPIPSLPSAFLVPRTTTNSDNV
ncbi:hypothetical protein L1987_59012 [Smallanthus sonchifolius]|uniref:Uncharacterized protein n=1 Tax=Smallanthus sonchifolius TaxID=185202 RepID=A0ACB9D4B8_9ASTR|nr:hypothetical protein L1987_59012 [Smallanthus sonchifolius]